MGNQNSSANIYSVPVSEKKQGETEARRSTVTVDGLVEGGSPGKDTLKEMWLNAVEQHGTKECLAQRDSNGKYKVRTFNEVHKISTQLGAGVRALNIVPKVKEWKEYELEMVGIYAKNREEWTMVDIGCGFLQGYTIVPLYDTLGPENLTYCLGHSNLSTVFASTESIDTLLKTEDLSNLKHIIALDTIKPEQKSKAEERGISMYSWKDVLEKGEQNPIDYATVNKEHVFTFSYTSGTTGKPKAAMLSHRNLYSSTGIFQTNPSFLNFIHRSKSENIPIVHLSYLPLPHVFERVIVSCILFLGGATYFYSGDVTKIKQDLADVRPTIFISVPRLYNKFYDKINETFETQPFLKKALIKIAIQAKLRNIENGPFYDHALFDDLVFKKIREGLFGGRVKVMITGSAPIQKDVLNFFQVINSCPLIEGYGQTESTAASFTKYDTDPLSGHIGGPVSNVEYKLEDIPEMNYLSTDKDAQGNECPRGEICMRGPGVFLGYYKDEEKTNEAIDKDGWLHSGDVGCLDRKSTRLKIIDRKKNIFKLSQGEYIAPEKVENVYLKVRGIAEAFIYGDSLQSTLVGIFHPEKEYIEELGQQLEIKGDFAELCENKEIRALILKNLTAQGKADKLFGFEQAKSILLFPESLATRGCFTNTMKLQRHLAKEAFQKEITQLYKEQQ